MCGCPWGTKGFGACAGGADTPSPPEPPAATKKQLQEALEKHFWADFAAKVAQHAAEAGACGTICATSVGASQKLKESGEKVSKALTELQKGERKQTHLIRQLEEQQQKVRKTQEEVDPRKRTSAAEAALAKASWRQASRREGIHGPASRSRAFKST